MPTSTGLNFTHAYTISFWAKRNGFTAYSNYITRGSGGSDDIEFYQQTSTQMIILHNRGNGGTVTAENIPALPDGQWTHVAITYDDSRASGSQNRWQIYYNGILQTGTNPISTGGPPLAVNTRWQIGQSEASVFGSTKNYKGNLDDMRVYNRALSSTEVTALYKEYNPQLNAASGENGLIGWWKLIGNAKDATPYGHDGTVTGAGLTTDRKGAANSAYSFDGSLSDYISVPNVGISSGSFTLAGWVKPGVQSDYETFVGYNTTHRILIQNTTGLLLTQFGGNFLSTHGLPFNTWSHIVYVYNSSTNTESFYINGSFDSQHTPTAAPVWNSAFKIGQYDLVHYPYKGSIGDVRVYNRAISGTEVSNLYKSYNSQISLYAGTGGGSSVNLVQGLKGEWDFTGNAKDATPYADNGSVSNATLTTDRFGNSNTAYSFNGTNAQIVAPSNTVFNASSNFTISCWAKSSTFSSMSSGVIVYRAGWWTIALGSPSAGEIRLADTAGNYAYTTSTYSNNVWHHIVGVMSGGSLAGIKIYVDGVQQTVNTNGAWTNGGGSNSVAIGSTIGGTYFNGSIDGVRIYNRALSAAEVTALYQLPY